MNPPGHFTWHWGSGDGIAEQSRNLIFQNNAERKRFEKNYEMMKKGHDRIMRGYDSEMVQIRQDIRQIVRKVDITGISMDGTVADEFTDATEEQDTDSKKSNSRARLRRRYMHTRSASSGSRIRVRDYINETRLPSRQKQEIKVDDSRSELKQSSSVKFDMADDTKDETNLPSTSSISNNEAQVSGKRKSVTPVAANDSENILPDTTETSTSGSDPLDVLPLLPVAKSKKGVVSDAEYEMRLKIDPLVLTRRRLQQSPSYQKANTRKQFDPLMRTIEYFSYKEKQNGNESNGERNSNDDNIRWLKHAQQVHPNLPSWELKMMRSDNSLPPLLLRKLSTMNVKDLQDDLRKVRASSLLSSSSMKSLDQETYLPSVDADKYGGNTGSTNIALYLKMAIRFRKKFGEGRHSSQRVQTRQLRRGWGNVGIQEEEIADTTPVASVNNS